jgi:hypothetical protein
MGKNTEEWDARVGESYLRQSSANLTQSQAVPEQLAHMFDLVKARLELIEARQAANQEIVLLKLRAVEERLNDHETRLRNATEGVTQFKTFSGLASGGATVASIIALIKAWFGN